MTTDDPTPSRRATRSYTVAALIVVFAGAAILALVSRLLPGRLSRAIGAVAKFGRRRDGGALG